MGTRYYNAAVVMFWLATMSWLLVDKVWPTLRVGDPPNYYSILKAAESEASNQWAIYWNDHLTGWSAGDLEQRPDGIRELKNRIFIADLPLDQLVPPWIGTAIKPVLNKAGRWDMDVRGKLEFDRLGRIISFDSSMRLAGNAVPVRIYGSVEGDQLKLHTPSGELPNSFSLSRDALVGDGMSPQGYLPDLYMGQTWTVFAYNLFHPTAEPLEVIEARVEQHESIVWNGKPVMVWLVVYRGESGAGLMGDPRARVWVREDGMVLQQELILLGSRLRFSRLSAERGHEFSQALEPYAEKEIPADASKDLLRLISSAEERPTWSN